MRYPRTLAIGALAALASTLILPAALTGSPAGAATSKPTIVIGSTNFEEQAIVSNIWADVLKKAGYQVTVEPALGTRAIVVPAIEKGQINLEPDYAASLLGFLHGGTPQAAGDNITTAIPADQKALASSGVTVLPAAKALDTNVFAVTKATANKDHLTTISSLKPFASKLTLGGPPECPTFAGCEPGLKKVYGLNFSGFKSLDEAGPLSVAALKNGEVQVVELFSSDGNVVSNNFVALTDNKHLEGADYIVPVIRKSVDTSGVAKVINTIDAKLTTTAISKLNLDVTSKQEQPAAVAQTWVSSVGVDRPNIREHVRADMEPRINVITLAVEDLTRSMAFYRDGLGLQTQGLIGTEFKGDETSPDGTIVTFVLQGGLFLALYPRTELAKDAGVPLPSAKPVGFSIGHAVARREEVDEVMAHAEAAGASVTDPPHDRPWGIYSGYFSDPDGHLWEILWNPALDLGTS